MLFGASYGWVGPVLYVPGCVGPIVQEWVDLLRGGLRRVRDDTGFRSVPQWSDTLCVWQGVCVTACVCSAARPPVRAVRRVVLVCEGSSMAWLTLGEQRPQ